MTLDRAITGMALTLGRTLAGLAVPSPALAQGPTVAGCPLLSADSIWNARVDGLPAAANSASYAVALASAIRAGSSG